MFWSNKLDSITQNRFNKIKNYIHHCSTYIINYCKKNDIDNLIIRNNDFWKQNINYGKTNNQNFVCIPFEMLINQLEYKCKDNQINFIVTEESYTSTTSFLDNELPNQENSVKNRRTRGLFKSNNGTKINADINASFQIAKKVFPKIFDGIEVCLTPIIIKNIMNEFKSQ